MGLIKNIENSGFLSGTNKPPANDYLKSIKKGVRVESIDVDNIVLDPENNKFNEYDNEEGKIEIKALAESIRLTGLRNPPDVREIGRNRYLMRSGEKRLRAAKEILGWKKIKCRIHDQLDENSPDYETEKFKDLIIFADNLTQRNYTDEQLFKIFYWFTEEIENSRDKIKLNDDAIMSFLNFSRNRYEKYKQIKKNTSKDDLDKFFRGELKFDDIKSLVKAQKEERRRQNIINEGVRIYSQSKSSDIRFYLDKANRIVYSVDEKIINKKIKYGVKYKDCNDHRPAQWLINNECPLVDDRNTAQAFLNKLAMINNFEECTAENYIVMLNESHKPNNKSKEKNESKKEVSEETKGNNKKLIFPKFKENDISLDNELVNNNEKENNDKKKDSQVIEKENTEDKVKKQISTNESQKQSSSEENKNDKHKKQHREEIDLIENKYALDILFVGEAKETKQIIKGTLLKTKHSERCFIAPQSSKLVIKQNDKKINSFVLATKAIEVVPSSVREFTKGKT